METKLSVDLHLDSSEGGLKELVLRWFIGTQAQIILQNGNFPSWFQGFTGRKHAEDLLADKAAGSFLIRLSDKTIGYILSYKGLDRCRHFVITQNQEGLFFISGDCHTYSCISDLIDHYKVSPIQPFGEYLTTSCFEANTGEVYDVVNYNSKGESGVSVHALQGRWDPNNKSIAGNNQRIQEQTDGGRTTVQPPALPPKFRNKKLTATQSVDSMSLSQAPAVPKRGVPLAFSLSGSFSDTSQPSNTQKVTNRAKRENTTLINSRSSHLYTDASYPGDQVAHSQHTSVGGRSKSVPVINKNKPDQQEETYSNQLNSPSLTVSASQIHVPAKTVTCHTYSLHDPTESLTLSNLWSEEQSYDLELFRSNPTSERPKRSSVSPRATMYAEIEQKPAVITFPDSTYEQVPGKSMENQANTYESLDDIKTKMPKSTWGKNDMKWKKFLPDYMKK